MIKYVNKLFFALSAGLAAVPALVVAAEADYPEPVRALVAQGVEIAARFSAPSGMIGYVGRHAGRPLVMYLSPDGEHVIVGRMLDALGQDLTEQQLEEHLPPPDLEGVWQQLEQADWIAEGATAPEQVVYIFTDPNCSYCHMLWQQTRPYLGMGIQLRHIVVGILQPSSRHKAARIYAAADQVEALRPPLRGALEQSENSEAIPREASQVVSRNNRLMQQLAVQITPTLFYRDGGGRVRMIAGLPDEAALAEEIFRRPRVSASP